MSKIIKNTIDAADKTSGVLSLFDWVKEFIEKHQFTTWFGGASMLSALVTMTSWIHDNLGSVFFYLLVFTGSYITILIATLCTFAVFRKITSGKKQEIVSNHNIKDLEVVYGKTFTKQDVVLDGKKFVSCKFDSCTLTFNGGYFEWDETDFSFDCLLQTGNKPIKNFMQLMMSLSQIGNGKFYTFDDRGRKKEYKAEIVHHET